MIQFYLNYAENVKRCQRTEIYIIRLGDKTAIKIFTRKTHKP